MVSENKKSPSALSPIYVEIVHLILGHVHVLFYNNNHNYYYYSHYYC